VNGLQLPWLAPAATIVSLVWAGWLALGAETGGDVPGGDRGGFPDDERTLPLARRFHLAHLTVLFFAGMAGSATVEWWSAAGVELVLRLGLVLALVWIVGDLLPRVVAEVAPAFTLSAGRGAGHSLFLLSPLFKVAAWADRRGRDRSEVEEQATTPENDVPAVRGLFTLAETTVAEIMTPRIDIVAVDTPAAADDVVETLRQSEYARLLVFDGTPDEVVGILYAKDVLSARLHEGASIEWHGLIRPATFVPVGKRLDRQLQEFQLSHHHMAVVVDEHGGTAGIVTLEDILEEIVGEIQDEHDADEVAEITEVDASTWLVEGVTPLADLEALVGQDFGREDVSTVGGLVMAEFGRVPSARESLHLAGYRLTVNQMVGRRVQRVLVYRLPAGEGHLPAEEAS
jgi:magnesium and cobalt transporter